MSPEYVHCLEEHPATPRSETLPRLAGALGATTAMRLGAYPAPFPGILRKAQRAMPGGDQGPATP